MFRVGARLEAVESSGACAEYSAEEMQNLLHEIERNQNSATAFEVSFVFTGCCLL